MAQNFLLKWPAGSRNLARMMTAHARTPANAERVAQLESVVADLLAETMQRGFFGTAAVELNIQDGTIQYIRRRVDRIVK